MAKQRFDVWTYASANSVTTPGDMTHTYWPGMRVALKQGTLKYFVIESVTYASPNTTIVLNGFGTYTIANAAITSHIDSLEVYPRGFPIVVATIATGAPGGQTICGGTAAGDDLVLESTAHATKGVIKCLSNMCYPAEICDKISLYDERLGATNGYCLGIETSCLYQKSSGSHRWYSGTNADGGTSRKMELSAGGNLYVLGSVDCSQVIDHTPGMPDKALKDIIAIKNDLSGNIDHSTLPATARAAVIETDPNTGIETQRFGRDLGAMISILTRSAQETITALNEAIKERDEKLAAFDERIKKLEAVKVA